MSQSFRRVLLSSTGIPSRPPWTRGPIRWILVDLETAKTEAPLKARALLAEQVGKFTLDKISENGEVSFNANGEMDLFGEEALTQLSGAGGQTAPR